MGHRVLPAKHKLPHGPGRVAVAPHRSGAFSPAADLVPPSPKRFRYFRNRSASFGFALLSRDMLNSFLPASDKDCDCRQTATTWASCTASNCSSRAARSGPRTSARSTLSVRAGRAKRRHRACRRRIPSRTIVSVLPPSASVATRLTDASRSRKFPVHSASAEVANRMKQFRASRLRRTHVHTSSRGPFRFR